MCVCFSDLPPAHNVSGCIHDTKSTLTVQCLVPPTTVLLFTRPVSTSQSFSLVLTPIHKVQAKAMIISLLANW